MYRNEYIIYNASNEYEKMGVNEMEVKLKGETLEGYFRGEMRFREGWAGSEYTERECTYYWYEGCGIIQKEDKQYFFGFRTLSKENTHCNPKDNLTLEESLVYLGGRDWPYEGNYRERFRKRIIPEKYLQLIDLVLSEFIAQVLACKDELPEVCSKALKLDDLIEKGLCYEDNGQVRIAFG